MQSLLAFPQGLFHLSSRGNVLTECCKTDRGSRRISNDKYVENHPNSAARTKVSEANFGFPASIPDNFGHEIIFNIGPVFREKEVDDKNLAKFVQRLWS